jgi:hypothetical protein
MHSIHQGTLPWLQELLRRENAAETLVRLLSAESGAEQITHAVLLALRVLTDRLSICSCPSHFVKRRCQLSTFPIFSAILVSNQLSP